jgi:hypothetical protein
LVRDALEQDVWVGLKPDRLGPARRLGRLGQPLQVFRAAPARTQGIQRAIGGDPVQPGTDRRASLEPLKAAPRGQQRLLEQIFGVLRRADDPVDTQLELTPVGVGQLAERVLVAGPRAGNRPLGHARILALRLLSPASQVPTSRRLEIDRSVCAPASASMGMEANPTRNGPPPPART